MDNNIKEVINLHKIDKRLHDINVRRGDLPTRICQLNEKIDVLSETIKEFNNRIQIIDKRKVIIEGELSDSDSKGKNLNNQIYKVKSNKEYEALLKEIDHIKGNNEIINNELLELELELENIDSSITNNNEELDALKEKLNKGESNLKETNLLFEEEEQNLLNDKNKIIKDIKHGDALKLYDEKKDEYQGLAFAEINRDSCANCYSNLPPQLVIDALNQTNFVDCPTCGILLYREQENLD
jgi:predicted  nucleic acid-binding Zn-ribbon protein